MTPPNFEQATHYALKRLERELSSKLSYHSLRHTLEDVLPAVERLAALENIHSEPLMLLRTAAAYHDLGFIEQYVDNEPIAVRIVMERLPDFGYSAAQIDVIRGIIMATKLPQSPHTLLEEIIADADLDVLGREDFFIWNHALRLELEAFGATSGDEEWYRRQLQFIKDHEYFTASAHNLRDTQKQTNAAKLVSLLAELSGCAS